MAMKALSVAPEQEFDGNDGPWSSFLVGFGTPTQFCKLLVSSSSPQPYVIIPGGCVTGDAPNCQDQRGGFFLTNESSTWQNIGDYTLGEELNLGYNDAGDFGFDDIRLGLPGTGAPKLEHQVVAGIVTKDFFLGSLGLRPAPTNFSGFDNPIPSLLQSLKSSADIPSLSWGYTAGSYRISQASKTSVGSLTLGGYDASRFLPSNVSFNFGEDISRDLLVGVTSISLQDASVDFLPSPILAFLDSAVSQIWLPGEACDRFASVFGLTYNSNLDLYLINATSRQEQLTKNSTVSFTLNNGLAVTANSTPVTINLPFSAFDLELTSSYPGDGTQNTSYFPLRRAANESQYTLGRAFFQHAYIIADYERSNFSVNQAIFPNPQIAPSLQAIAPLKTKRSMSESGLSAGIVAGIVIGAIAFVLLLTAVGFWIWTKRRRSKTELAFADPQGSDPPLITSMSAKITEISAEEKTELSEMDSQRAELEGWLGNGRLAAQLAGGELPGTTVERQYELPGDTRLP